MSKALQIKILPLVALALLSAVSGCAGVGDEDGAEQVLMELVVARFQSSDKLSSSVYTLSFRRRPKDGEVVCVFYMGGQERRYVVKCDENEVSALEDLAYFIRSISDAVEIRDDMIAEVSPAIADRPSGWRPMGLIASDDEMGLLEPYYASAYVRFPNVERSRRQSEEASNVESETWASDIDDDIEMFVSFSNKVADSILRDAVAISGGDQALGELLRFDLGSLARGLRRQAQYSAHDMFEKD